MNLPLTTTVPLSIAFLIGGVAILRSPFIGILLIAILMPAENFLLIGGRTYIWPLAIVTLGAWLLRLKFTSGRIRIACQPTFLAILWLFWGAVSFFWVADRRSFVERLILLAGFIVLFVLFQDLVRRAGQLKVLLLVYFIASALFALFSIGFTLLSGLNRAVLTQAQSPNTLARELGIGLLLTPYVFHQLKGRCWKFFAMVGVGFLVVAIFLTGSRGTWIGLVMAFGFTWLITRGRVIRFRSILVTLIILIITIVSLNYFGIILDYSIERIVTLPSEVIQTASGRWNVWRVGWELVKANPFVGVGLGNFPVRFEDYIDVSGLAGAYAISPGRGPHGIFLSVQGELGIIGFIIVLSFFWKIFRRLLIYQMDIRATIGILLLSFMFFSGISDTIQIKKFFCFALSLASLIPLVIHDEKD